MITFVKTNPKSINNIWNSGIQTLVFGTTVEGKVPSKSILAGLDNYDPQALHDFRQKCIDKEVHLGVPVLIVSRRRPGKQYIFCPIKARSGDAPKELALESCLRTINANGGEWGITSIATHPMGCGSSDVYLNWEQEVYPLMHTWLSAVPVPVTIYGASNPQPAPVVVVEDEPITSVMPSVKPFVVDGYTTLEQIMDAARNDPDVEYTVYHAPEWIL